jgi:CubicO group peptidase (beta-lactamase class C family)
MARIRHGAWRRARKRIGAGLLGIVLAMTLPVSAVGAEVRCAEPAQRVDGWAVGRPDDQGFDSAVLCSALDGVARGAANIHGVVVARGNHIVAELYRPGPDRSIYSLFASRTAFDAATLHDVRSISKSVVALLVGIAAGEGRIDVTRPVLDYFPEFADLRTPERLAVTVEHLLTMSSGLEWHEMLSPGLGNNETRLYWDFRPLRYVLARQQVAAPGRVFNYSGGSTALLAEIVERATGTRLLDYARKRLFQPLGIERWQWVASPYGRPLAFAGLRLTPRDLMKIGRILLDGGRWNGRQVVPRQWVLRALKTHVATGGGPAPGYGYQFWTGEVAHGGRSRAFVAAIGNGGQRLFLVPDLDLAVAITAGAYNEMAFNRVVQRLFEQVVAAARP